MRNLKWFGILLLALFCAAGAYAQTAASETTAAVYPSVSRIQAEIKNNLLRLTWSDSPDARGPVYIHRSAEPFGDNLALSRIMMVPYGVEAYIDEIDDSGTYYYFIASSGINGPRYDAQIMPGNSISLQMTGIYSARVETPPEPPATPVQGISNVRAQAENENIIITFRTGANISPVLYRSLRPIRDTQDLLGAVIIRTGAMPPLIDTPVPGIPYYYAVIPESELTRGAVAIRPGDNATTQPVEVVFQTRAQAGIRTVPLPHISLTKAAHGFDSFEETPLINELSPETSGILENIPSVTREPAALRARQVFPQDLETSISGEEYILASIVQRLFVNNEWNRARDELIRFISVPRSRNAEARARHYLGQCYFFLRSPRDAIFEFLQARSVYNNETVDWVQATLKMMTE